jgi:hypothetical protein
MSSADLQEFYQVYCPPRFPSAKTRRAKQALARRLRLPVIRAGNTSLIDPIAGDDRLRQIALHQELPDRPRRGRPRAIG